MERGLNLHRTRNALAGAVAVGVAYLAFAVGAPWLLCDAPPDTYVVIATTAACPAHADAAHVCERPSAR